MWKFRRINFREVHFSSESIFADFARFFCKSAKRLPLWNLSCSSFYEQKSTQNVFWRRYLVWSVVLNSLILIWIVSTKNKDILRCWLIYYSLMQWLTFFTIYTLSLSWRGSISYRNQSTALLANQWAGFFYDSDLPHERVRFKEYMFDSHESTMQEFKVYCALYPDCIVFL